MYEIIKQVIMNGGYKLSEIRHRIMKLYAHGQFSDGQMDELLALASGGASAESERPDVMAMLHTLNKRYDDHERRLKALESADTENGTEGDAGSDSELTYPEWEPWDGLSDNYQYGKILQHKGKIWKSTYEGQNVWEPGALGVDERYWVEYSPDAAAPDDAE